MKKAKMNDYLKRYTTQSTGSDIHELGDVTTDFNYRLKETLMKNTKNDYNLLIRSNFITQLFI